MNLIQKRIGLLSGAFCVLLAIAGTRAAYLGIVKGDSLAAAANVQQEADVHVPARRGAIVDRRGVELAVAEPADDVSVTPYLVRNPAKVASQLSPVKLAMTPSAVAVPWSLMKVASSPASSASQTRAAPSSRKSRGRPDGAPRPGVFVPSSKPLPDPAASSA